MRNYYAFCPAGHFLWKWHWHSQNSCSMWISKVQRRWGPPALVLPPTLQHFELLSQNQWLIKIGYTDRTVSFIAFKWYILFIIVIENCGLKKGKNAPGSARGDFWWSGPCLTHIPWEYHCGATVASEAHCKCLLWSLGSNRICFRFKCSIAFVWADGRGSHILGSFHLFQ